MGVLEALNASMGKVLSVYKGMAERHQGICLTALYVILNSGSTACVYSSSGWELAEGFIARKDDV